MINVCVYFSQASYLVGLSDPNSQAGHQGLVDPIQFARANQAIQMACQNLVDPQSSPSQVPKYNSPSLLFVHTYNSSLHFAAKCVLKLFTFPIICKRFCPWWLAVVRSSLHHSVCFSLFAMLQVLSSATIVAKHTSALCNACRLASSKTTNPVAKRHFVQSAKEVANTTANLVKTIKVGQNWHSTGRQGWQNSVSVE